MNTEETAVASPLAALRPKMELHGKVTKIELYGAFIDVGVGQDGLLHISQISSDPVKNVNDKLKIDDEITVWVRNVDPEQGRIDLTAIQPPALDWSEIQKGQVVTGKIIRIEKFGAFLDIGAERPGMIHVSELANNYINSPTDVVQLGQEIQARVINVSSKKKQIDLSVKALEEKIEVPKQIENDLDVSKLPTAMELALRGAMQGTEMGEQLIAAKKPAKGRTDSKVERNRKAQTEAITRTLQNRPK